MCRKVTFLEWKCVGNPFLASKFAENYDFFEKMVKNHLYKCNFELKCQKIQFLPKKATLFGHILVNIFKIKASIKKKGNPPIHMSKIIFMQF